MEKEELFQKAEQALNQAFDAAKKSAKVVAEKAGQAAHATRLLVEKASLEHQVTRQFTRLGGRVYQKAVREEGSSFAGDPEIRGLVDETKRLEDKLAEVEDELAQETRQKKLARKRSRS